MEEKCDMKDMDFLHDQFLDYRRQGDILQSQGKLQEAQRYYEKALSIAEERFDSLGTISSKEELVEIYGKLGHILERQKDMEGAKDYYWKELYRLEELLSQKKANPLYSEDLALVYYKLGILGEPKMLYRSFEIFDHLAMIHPYMERYAKRRNRIFELLKR